MKLTSDSSLFCTIYNGMRKTQNEWFAFIFFTWMCIINLFEKNNNKDTRKMTEVTLKIKLKSTSSD